MRIAGEKPGKVYEWKSEEDSLLMAFCLCTTGIHSKNCAVFCFIP